MTDLRKETDSLGEVEVPAEKLWGAQTQRSLELTASAWLPKLKQIIPSYGVSLIDDADFCRQIRATTAEILKVDDIQRPVTRVSATRRA